MIVSTLMVWAEAMDSRLIILTFIAVFLVFNPLVDKQEIQVWTSLGPFQTGLSSLGLVCPSGDWDTD